jgi:hypothetical protein
MRKEVRGRNGKWRQERQRRKEREGRGEESRRKERNEELTVKEVNMDRGVLRWEMYKGKKGNGGKREKGKSLVS